MARVLIVDDEADIRYLVKVNLELDGHHVDMAADGAEALAKIQADPPDLVVLDLMMPVVDGWEVLESIKSEPEPEIQNIPVLMLTAFNSDDNRLKSGIEGAVRFLGKPFVPDDLRTEVTAALEAGPEPEQRRRVQTEALEELARQEKGDEPTSAATRPHITRLERTASEDEPPRIREARAKLDSLTDKQLELLRTLESTPSVTDAAEQMEVSRSNIYASLRRIGRKLGTQSVPELLALVRAGGLLRDL